MRTLVVALAVLLAGTVLRAQESAPSGPADLMPLPAEVVWQAGRLPLDAKMTVATAGPADPRVAAAWNRVLTRLQAMGVRPAATAASGAGFTPPGAAKRTRSMSGGEFTSPSRKTRAGGLGGRAASAPQFNEDAADTEASARRRRSRRGRGSRARSGRGCRGVLRLGRRPGRWLRRRRRGRLRRPGQGLAGRGSRRFARRTVDLRRLGGLVRDLRRQMGHQLVIGGLGAGRVEHGLPGRWTRLAGRLAREKDLAPRRRTLRLAARRKHQARRRIDRRLDDAGGR
jgi:hypothetical protein